MRWLVGSSVVFLLSVWIISCSSSETSVNDFIYRNHFPKQPISKTLTSGNEAGKIVALNEIADSLLTIWVEPFRRRGIQNKMQSYLYSNQDYHVITIMIIDEIFVDRESSATEIPLSSQYVLTVKDDGSLIDGLKVHETISKDYLKDTLANGMEIMSKHKWSLFKRDTIITQDIIAYIKETVLSERQDYVEGPQGKTIGTLETVLQEEIESIDETTFIIDSKGKIKKNKESKGVLNKLSESTGERIKLK